MSLPTRHEFLSRFPEFGEQSPSVVDGALSEAGRATPPSVWGAVRADGASYLAAHLLSTRTMQIGMQVGSPSGPPSGQLTQSTLYGQEYERLFRGLALTGFAI
jgi:hypothetical protein